MEPEQPPPVIVLAYDGIAADEAGAVVEILASAGVPVIIASVEADPVTSYHGRVVPERAAAELGPSSALVVPGGMGVRAAASDERLLSAIRHLAVSARWLGATSTGSVLLVAAGLADRARVTTHWLAGDLVTARGVELVDEPYVEHGRVLTAGGLASTATLSFRLVGAILGWRAEQEAKAHYRPRPLIDRRYRIGGPRLRRRRAVARLRGGAEPRWRWIIGRKRVEQISGHALDPTGAAEIIVLELPDQPGGRRGP